MEIFLSFRVSDSFCLERATFILKLKVVKLFFEYMEMGKIRIKYWNLPMMFHNVLKSKVVSISRIQEVIFNLKRIKLVPSFMKLVPISFLYQKL